MPEVKEEPTPWIVFDAPDNGSRVFVKCLRCKAYLGFPTGYPVQKAETILWTFQHEHKSCEP